jgi:hypothetical protein
MSWIIGLALVALGIYFTFLRKPRSNEIIIRIETTSATKITESDSPESFDEE